MQNKSKPIKFPKDELVHDHIIEWWYFNGHLKDKKGNKYAFMNCLFRADVKKVKIPFLSKIPLKTIYFFHSLLSDIKNKEFYPSTDYLSIISKDSFFKPLLFINHTNPAMAGGYINRVIEETKKFSYRLKDKNVDLKLTSVKSPLLEGGTGYLNLGTKSTYYYSLTNLKTKGVIKIKNKEIEVEGKSWMDHQWANIGYSKDIWTWFSLQLDNGIEMVCFEYDDRKTKTRLFHISYADDRQEHGRRVEFTPLGAEWTSPKTKAAYPLSWRIRVPQKNIDLKVAPFIENQEMIFGSINYWEGPLKANGIFAGKKVKGVGFMELVGYPSKWNNLQFAKSELGNTINKIFVYTQNGARDIIKGKTKIANK